MCVMVGLVQSVLWKV